MMNGKEVVTAERLEQDIDLIIAGGSSFITLILLLIMGLYNG